MSADVFAKGTAHSVEWVRSVERGVTCPTRLGLAGLARGFVGEDAPKDLVRSEIDDIWRVYRDIDDHPFGALAQKLREDGRISPPDPVQQATDPDGLLPLLHGIRYRDRLLTVTPLVLLAVFVGAFVLGEPWSEGAVQTISVDFDGLAFLGIGAVLVAALFMPLMHRVVQAACTVFRRGKVRERHRYLQEVRSTEQAVAPDGSWYALGEGPYLVDHDRNLVESSTLEADLTERLAIIFALTSVLYATAFGFTAASGASPSTWGPWLALGVAAAAMTAAMLRSLRRLAIAIPVFVNDAYGAPRER